MEDRNILEVLIEEHIEKFGIEPYIIGRFWSNPDALIDGIDKAIEKNEPYNEYKMMSKEMQEAYDKGTLLF